MNEKLRGKTIYGFGDSLIYGHSLKIGMLDHLAEENQLIYTKYAVNGASVIPKLAGKRGDAGCMVPDIAQQIEEAKEECPDYICFDGLMNDCYSFVTENYLGKLKEGYEGAYDLSTYTGAFENICMLLRRKYQDSRIFYVSVHRTSSRDFQAQEILHARSLEVCRKWAVPVADIYNEGGINTAIPGMRHDYSYDDMNNTVGGNGTHLNAEGYKKWYTPMIEALMISIL